MNDDLTAYCGPPAIHDARVRRVVRSGNELLVELATAEGGRLIVRFAGVTEVVEHQSMGMMLYALRAEGSTTDTRRFEFVNWDESDAASLMVAAERVSFE